MKKRKAVKKTAAKKHTTKKSQAKSKRAATTAAKRKALNGRRKKSRVKSARSRKAKAKTVRGKTSRKRLATATKKPRAERVLGRSPAADPREFSRGEMASRQAGQSGDIQGLSDRAGADSESIEELIDEGNAFEADAVEGVERAGNSTREVRTRQVPEDDVPGEYLDED